MRFMKINFGDFYIRPLKKGDEKSLAKHANDKKVAMYLERLPSPYTLKDAKWFVDDSLKQWKKGSAYRFAIVVDGKVVGICGLDNVYKKGKEHYSDLGYWLGRKYWRKGIMSKVVKAVVNFGFVEKKMHRISVCYVEENIGSGKIIRNLGFVEEGVARNAHFRDGKWQNLIKFGMLRKEWKN